MKRKSESLGRGGIQIPECRNAGVTNVWHERQVDTAHQSVSHRFLHRSADSSLSVSVIFFSLLKNHHPSLCLFFNLFNLFCFFQVFRSLPQSRIPSLQIQPWKTVSELGFLCFFLHLCLFCPENNSLVCFVLDLYQCIVCVM